MHEGIRLPRDWDHIRTQLALAGLGECLALVRNVRQKRDNRIEVELEVHSEGRFKGQRLSRVFDLDKGVDRDALKQFVVALGIRTTGRELDPGACKDKGVRIALSSGSADDGRAIVNILAFDEA
ncbi:MAG TPA: hypothetical protein PLM14_14120 [Candidatus Hydrogenedentes bacterium]|nr:hypothetical protein [Candidatus Hydrogenedentota bacterium]